MGKLTLSDGEYRFTPEQLRAFAHHLTDALACGIDWHDHEMRPSRWLDLRAAELKAGVADHLLRKAFDETRS